MIMLINFSYNEKVQGVLEVIPLKPTGNSWAPLDNNIRHCCVVCRSLVRFMHSMTISLLKASALHSSKERGRRMIHRSAEVELDPTWLQGGVEIEQGGSAQLMNVGLLFELPGVIQGFLQNEKEKSNQFMPMSNRQLIVV